MVDDIKNAIRDVPNFPKEGVVFKDIAPVLENGALFKGLLSTMAERLQGLEFTKIAAIESRGFLLGSALASHFGKGLVLVRKKGKLPWKTVSESYALEYGEATIEVQEDSMDSSDKIIVIDDVLATGGTANAAIKLCRKLGAEVTHAHFFIELDFLKGRDILDGVKVDSVIHY